MMSRKNKRKKIDGQTNSQDLQDDNTVKRTEPKNENVGSMSKWKEKYFTFHGRLNRKLYFQYNILAIVYCVFIAWLFYLGGIVEPNSPNSFNYLSLAMVLIIPTAWLFLSINIRRWHDLGRRGYFIWINFFCLTVPVLYIFLLLYLCYKKGTTGVNQFGADNITS